MSLSLWQQCLARLQDELPATEFSMWIRPLQAELSDNTLALYAPNRFVLDWVRDKYLNNINGLLTSFCGADAPQLRFEVGTKPVTQTPQAAVTSNVAAPAQVAQTQPQRAAPSTRSGWDNVPAPAEPTYRSNVNVKHTFDNFVEGKSNQLARAAARQVADNLAVLITRCSFMAARVWVKLTCCMRWVTALWRASRMPKWFICTPSALFRTWLKPCKTTRSKSLNATTVP